MNVTNLYTRNAVKETLQDIILSFVYNTPEYNQLIFTGGTCLRKVYGLNRLSEDLDFDIPKDTAFDIRTFAKSVKKYLLSLGTYSSIETKISGNNPTRLAFEKPDSHPSDRLERSQGGRTGS